MNLMEKFEAGFDKLTPLFNKIASNTFLQSLSGGMMATMPVTMLGSISLLLCVVPMGPVTTFIQASGIAAILMNVYNYTMGMLAVYMVFFIARTLGRNLVEGDDGVVTGIIALISFLILTPMGVGPEGTNMISFEWLGAAGCFTSIVAATITAYSYKFFKTHNLTIKMPDGVPPMVANVFASLIPALVIPTIFMAINYAFSLTSFGCFHQAIYSLLQAPMMSLGGNIWAVLLISFLAQLLWFFGLHGQNVLGPFYNPIWQLLDAENLAAISAGLAAPHIVGSAFYQVFCFGGYQIALCLLMMRARSQQYRQLGKICMGPAIFGIGEPLNFGMPLILNFKFIIPFLTNGVFMLLVAYFAIATGLVPHLNGAAFIFGLPFGVMAFLEGGWAVLILAIVCNIILPYFLWMPWVKMADKEAYAMEKEAEEENAKALVLSEVAE